MRSTMLLPTTAMRPVMSGPRCRLRDRSGEIRGVASVDVPEARRERFARSARERADMALALLRRIAFGLARAGYSEGGDTLILVVEDPPDRVGHGDGVVGDREAVALPPRQQEMRETVGAGLQFLAVEDLFRRIAPGLVEHFHAIGSNGELLHESMVVIRRRHMAGNGRARHDVLGIERGRLNDPRPLGEGEIRMAKVHEVHRGVMAM